MTVDNRVIKVCIAGALGKVGRNITKACLEQAEVFQLVSAVSRRHSGEDIGSLLGNSDIGIALTSDIDEALASAPDVLIDYTHPTCVKHHIHAAVSRRINCVIGTTGLMGKEFLEIDELARAMNVGVVTGNFSLTAALLQHFAKIAAEHINDWEIIESAPETKPDVPSGTARELAEMLKRRQEPGKRPFLIGIPEARGAVIDDTHVHSLRLPGNSRSIDVAFGLAGERLTLRHEENDPSVFVRGTLYATRKVTSLRGLVRGLDSLLFSRFGAADADQVSF